MERNYLLEVQAVLGFEVVEIDEVPAEYDLKDNSGVYNKNGDLSIETMIDKDSSIKVYYVTEGDGDFLFYCIEKIEVSAFTLENIIRDILKNNEFINEEMSLLEMDQTILGAGQGELEDPFDYGGKMLFCSNGYITYNLDSDNWLNVEFEVLTDVTEETELEDIIIKVTKIERI